MPIPNKPFADVKDQLISSLMMGGDGIAGERIVLDETPKGLFQSQLAQSAKPRAKYALIMVETDSPDAIVAKCLEYAASNYTIALNDHGMLLGKYAVIEIKGTTNLANFRAIAVGNTATTSLIVHYYE